MATALHMGNDLQDLEEKFGSKGVAIQLNNVLKEANRRELHPGEMHSPISIGRPIYPTSSA